MQNKAFTLIETSVIIIIIALILSSSLFLHNYYDNLKKTKITEKNIIIIRNSLKDYFYLYKKLPCPADLTLDIYDVNVARESNIKDGSCITNYGISDEDSDGISIVPYDNYYGGVPAKTLGLSKKYLFDGWGRKLSYIVNKSVINSITKEIFNNSLKCWIDSRETDAIFLENNSNLITGILDKSGNNCNLSSALGARSKYILAEGQGKIFFDKKDEQMLFNDLNNNLKNTLQNPHSLFFVFHPFYNNNNFFLFNYDSNDDNKGYSIQNNNKNFLIDKKNINNHNSLINGLEILSILRESDGSAKVISTNNAESDYNTSSFSSDDKITNILLSSGSFRGYIYEIMIFNKILSKKEEAIIRKYLNHKWRRDHFNIVDNSLEIKIASTKSTKSIIRDPAIVIISHGKNGYGAFNSAGIQINPKQSTNNSLEKENLTKYWKKNDKKFIKKAKNFFYTDLKNQKLGSGWTNLFDDIVRYYSVQDLQQ